MVKLGMGLYVARKRARNALRDLSTASVSEKLNSCLNRMSPPAVRPSTKRGLASANVETIFLADGIAEDEVAFGAGSFSVTADIVFCSNMDSRRPILFACSASCLSSSNTRSSLLIGATRTVVALVSAAMNMQSPSRDSRPRIKRLHKSIIVF